MGNQELGCKTGGIETAADQGLRGLSQKALIEEGGKQSVLGALQPLAAAIYDEINGATDLARLDNIARTVWASWGKGEFTDQEATFLTTAVDTRRPMGRGHSAHGVTMKPVGRLAGRFGSRFTPRRPQRSPDREASRNRRRMLGGSAVLPDNLRHHYTEGERAVLCIVAGEVKLHGICDLPIDKIAALAGVCRTLVQNTMHEAHRLGHITITERPQLGRKSLTNIVQISSPEWRAWVRRGPSAHRPIGSNSLKIMSTTKNTDLRKKEAIDEELQIRGHGPPQRLQTRAE